MAKRENQVRFEWAEKLLKLLNKHSVRQNVILYSQRGANGAEEVIYGMEDEIIDDGTDEADWDILRKAIKQLVAIEDTRGPITVDDLVRILHVTRPMACKYMCMFLDYGDW